MITPQQMFTLGGGAAQLAALIWAAASLYRAWKALAPSDDLFPRLSKGLRWLRARWERLRYWLTLRPQIREVTAKGVLQLRGDSAIGFVVGTLPEPTLDSRVAALEADLPRVESRLSARIDALKEDHIEAIDKLRSERESDRAASAKRESESTRVSLGGPLFLGIAGTLLQTFAAFV